MNPREYFHRCESHDWYHDWSDDHGEWTRGQSDRRALAALARTCPVLRAIWEAWNAYAYSGARFGTPQAQRPVCEELVTQAVSTFGGPTPQHIDGQLSLTDTPDIESDTPRKPRRRVLFGEAA